MNKKNKNKQNINKDFLDVSYRKNLNVDIQQGYSDEELSILIKELEKELEQMKVLHKKYYSSNSYIDRISKRNFWDILQEKITSSICIFITKFILKSDKKS